MKTFKLLFTALLLLCCVAANAIDVKVDSIYYSVTSFSDKTVEVISGEDKYTGGVVIPDSVAIFVSNQAMALNDWRSERIGDSQTSSHTYTLNVVSGSVLEFDWKVSSESGYDKLIVTISNSQLLEKSGTDQGHFSHTFTEAGIYDMVVKYTKDGSQSHGDDCAEVYNISLSGNNYNDTEGEEIVFSVTGIGASAFKDCDSLTSVTFPDCIVSISDSAFYGCTSLANVEIPNSVTSIGSSVFSGCTSLVSVEIPNSVTSIGSSAFSGCTSLVSVEIPNSVTSIGSSAFSGCTSLVSVEIPNSVTSIGNFAFDDCTSLKNLRFEDGDSCLSLGYNNYYDSGEGLFYDCPLDTLYLGRALNYNTSSSYGHSPFGYNATLRTAVISDCVMNIGERLFYGCSSLVGVEIGSGVTSIGSYAFYNCDALTSINIPNSVTSIGDYAFRNCDALTSATIGNGVKNIPSYMFYDCNNLVNVELGDSVTSLGEYAFSATNIFAMELPATLTHIGYNALPPSMLRLTCNTATPPTLLNDSYGNYQNLGNISIVYVPTGCGAAYRAVYPWSSKVIVDGSGVAVNVSVTPGMLGEEILTQANYLADVNYLTVSGSINDVDINNIKNSMPNLLTIDMSGLDMKSIPSEMFNSRRALLSVILPNNVETIEWAAFYNCVNIESMVFPEGLKKICGGGYWYPEDGSFNGCTSLKTVSFPSTLEEIEGHAFRDCSSLREVEFKSGLKRIGYYAFYRCSNLRNIIFNKGLEFIGDFAFESCTALRSIVVPETLRDLSVGAFRNCSSLENITLDGLTSIGKNYYTSNSSGVFEGCTSLTTVEIPEGVTYVGSNTFRNCTNITEVSLPSTLVNCGETPFAGCNKLSDVTCLALLPPTLASGLLTLEDMGLPLQRTLYVPEWTMNRYKLTSGWAAFSAVVPISNFYPASINIVNDAVLTLPAAGLPANYKPDMKIEPGTTSMEGYAYGVSASLHLRGNGTLSLSNFVMDCGYNASMAQLLNEAEMTADSVAVEMYLESYRNSSTWNFLSFPFDVKVSDIVTNCDWVIRKYDGEARANGDLNNTWVTVPYDSILHAGQGYIWSCSGGDFAIPAMDNDNKNMIFADSTCYVPLTEYASEYISNSSWNLVGNPYPCYYDISKLGYTAPVTVWENNTYSAYSPVDDSYILKPFEAFFVQCPENVKSIAFESDGRQLSAPASAPSPAPSHTRGAKVSREVINITLDNGESSDRTRVVINDAAKMDYEIACDAAKFMSGDAAIPQIYTVSGNDKYAINERPLNDGIVEVGTRFGMDGSYTIALQGTCGMSVVLVDLKNGTETDLTAGGYTFMAETSDINRFEIRVNAKENTTAVEVVSAETVVTATADAIMVANPAGADVEVYNLAGMLVASGEGRSLTFNVAQGVYVVKVNGVSHKIAVMK